MNQDDMKLAWRSVLAHDGRFDEWVRDLSDRSGVYLIRSDPSRFEDQLLYIGESHSYDNPGTRRSYRGLYRTLTRHFHGHSWSQGLTYNPYDVLVAVILTTPEQAIEYQDTLIAAYQPRDNEQAKQLRLEAWGISPEEAEAYALEYDPTMPEPADESELYPVDAELDPDDEHDRLPLDGSYDEEVPF